MAEIWPGILHSDPRKIYPAWTPFDAAFVVGTPTTGRCPRDRERISNTEGWKGTSRLAADMRYYGEWMREKAWEHIGHLYPKGQMVKR